MEGILRGGQFADDVRLSSDELDKLRVWLAASGRLGERADGAVTVADLAEACGVDASEVFTQLRQIRAERAFEAGSAKKKSQTLLLVLALAMLTVAGMILFIKPPHERTMAETLALLQEKQTKNKRVHYPIEKDVDLGPLSPPQGLPLELDGRYIIVTAKPPQNGHITFAEATGTQLAKSLEALAFEAQKLEERRRLQNPEQSFFRPAFARWTR